MLALALLLAAAPEAATAVPEINDVRDLADLSERSIAIGDVGVLQVGRDGQLTATSQGIRLTTPPAWLQAPGRTGAGAAPGASARAGHAAKPPPILPGFTTTSYGSSVEVRWRLTGLAVRAGQLWLPLGAEASRPAYFVFDHRPAWFWTAAQFRKSGVQASLRPVPNLALTVGGYNDQASFRVGGALVKDAVGRAEVDFGRFQAGAFGFVGTGRWFGDSTRLGFDLRTRVGPVQISGQVLRGSYFGIEQTGWYAQASHDPGPGTTVTARLDAHNPDIRVYSGLDSHALLALQRRVSPRLTVRLNLQVGLADPIRPQAVWPSAWAVVGQAYQRF